VTLSRALRCSLPLYWVHALCIMHYNTQHTRQQRHHHYRRLTTQATLRIYRLIRTDQRRWARPHHGRHEHVSLVPTPSPSHRTHLVGAAARAMGTLQLPSPARFLPLRRNAVAAAGDSLAENPAVSEHSGVYTAHTPRDQSGQGRVLWQATVETSSRSCHAIACSGWILCINASHSPAFAAHYGRARGA
jgi:hypothetical protein